MRPVDAPAPHALIFATVAIGDGSPSALLSTGGSGDDATIIGALAAGLRAVGTGTITVVTRPAWGDELRHLGFDVTESADTATDLEVIAKVAANATGSVVLTAADIVSHRSVLAHIAAVRVRRTVAAVTTRHDVPVQPIMRQRDQVISVGTAFHKVTGVNAGFLGLLSVSSADRPALITACTALRALPDLDRVADGYGAIGLTLLGLVRANVRVSAYSVRHLSCARLDVTSASTPDMAAQTAKSAVAALSDIDEDQAALRAGLKEDEEFLATHLVQSYTPRLVRMFARAGITPNGVTWISIAIGIAAALSYATGNRALAVVGSVLLYFSFVFDCCDGQLARYTGQFSRYGGWLDMIGDRAKEYIVFVGLAIGGVRQHSSGMWGLALAAIVLQTVRHMIDTWYGALQETATRSLPAVPLDEPLDRLGLRAGTSTRASVGARLGQLSAAAHGQYRSFAYYAKRTVVLPIGDRWLLILVVAAIFGPKWTFITLLAAATLAFGYVFAGRTLRALSMRVSVVPRFNITQQRDDGPIARAIGRIATLPPVAVTLPATVAALAALLVPRFRHAYPHPVLTVLGLAILVLVAAFGARAKHDKPLDWLFSAGLRAAEYTFIVAAGVYGKVPLPLIYTLLGLLVMIHYDTASRIEKAASPFTGASFAAGWDGRVVLLAAAVALGWATPGFILVTVLVGAVLIGGTITGLRRPA